MPPAHPGGPAPVGPSVTPATPVRPIRAGGAALAESPRPWPVASLGGRAGRRCRPPSPAVPAPPGRVLLLVATPDSPGHPPAMRRPRRPSCCRTRPSARRSLPRARRQPPRRSRPALRQARSEPSAGRRSRPRRRHRRQALRSRPPRLCVACRSGRVRHPGFPGPPCRSRRTSHCPAVLPPPPPPSRRPPRRPSAGVRRPARSPTFRARPPRSRQRRRRRRSSGARPTIRPIRATPPRRLPGRHPGRPRVECHAASQAGRPHDRHRRDRSRLRIDGGRRARVRPCRRRPAAAAASDPTAAGRSPSISEHPTAPLGDAAASTGTSAAAVFRSDQFRSDHEAVESGPRRALFATGRGPLRRFVGLPRATSSLPGPDPVLAAVQPGTPIRASSASFLRSAALAPSAAAGLWRTWDPGAAAPERRVPRTCPDDRIPDRFAGRWRSRPRHPAYSIDSREGSEGRYDHRCGRPFGLGDQPVIQRAVEQCAARRRQFHRSARPRRIPRADRVADPRSPQLRHRRPAERAERPRPPPSPTLLAAEAPRPRRPAAGLRASRDRAPPPIAPEVQLPPRHLGHAGRAERPGSGTGRADAASTGTATTPGSTAPSAVTGSPAGPGAIPVTAGAAPDAVVSGAAPGPIRRSLDPTVPDATAATTRRDSSPARSAWRASRTRDGHRRCVHIVGARPLEPTRRQPAGGRHLIRPARAEHGRFHRRHAQPANGGHAPEHATGRALVLRSWRRGLVLRRSLATSFREPAGAVAQVAVVGARRLLGITGTGADIAARRLPDPRPVLGLVRPSAPTGPDVGTGALRAGSAATGDRTSTPAAVRRFSVVPPAGDSTTAAPAVAEPPAAGQPARPAEPKSPADRPRAASTPAAGGVTPIQQASSHAPAAPAPTTACSDNSRNDNTCRTDDTRTAHPDRRQAGRFADRTPPPVPVSLLPGSTVQARRPARRQRRRERPIRVGPRCPARRQARRR